MPAKKRKKDADAANQKPVQTLGKWFVQKPRADASATEDNALNIPAPVTSAVDASSEAAASSAVPTRIDVEVPEVIHTKPPAASKENSKRKQVVPQDVTTQWVSSHRGLVKPMPRRAPWTMYNATYTLRLEQLRPLVFARACTKWASEVPRDAFVVSLGNNTSLMRSECVLVGLLCKNMTKRPNIIERYRDVRTSSGSSEQCDNTAKSGSLCSKDDTYWLEDGSARLQLDLSEALAVPVATGIVAAVRGVLLDNGRFKVAGLCFPGAEVPPVFAASHGYSVEDPLLALVSGLAFGSDVDQGPRERILDFLLERGASLPGARQRAAVQHLVVCGGTLVQNQGDTRCSGARAVAALADADSFFAKLSKVMAIDLMPGHGDPSNLSLPQAPLHPYLFRQSKESPNFRLVGNPYDVTLGGLRVVGHSGQPVEDLLRCTQISSPLDALSLSLDAGHLAPTTPDTLPAQPFEGTDPFVLSTAPHVFFSAGHDREAYQWHAATDSGIGTMCVCVPSFHQRPALVLVSLLDPQRVQVPTFD